MPQQRSGYLEIRQRGQNGGLNIQRRKVKQLPIFFFTNGLEFQVSHAYSNGVAISILDNGESSESNVTVIPFKTDSVLLIWKYDLQESMQPIQRVQNYRRAKKIRNSMTDILNSFANFLQTEENIYGIRFQTTMSQDSTLVMTKGATTSFPSVNFIYGMIGELKEYIHKEGAMETNHPMIDVKKINDQQYETMVAIPVNKELPGKGLIIFSRFVPWKVLTAEVKGGVKTVEKALRQMDLYVNDHQLTRMAISFQSLVTNRAEQPDSTQWITRIYTPVP